MTVAASSVNPRGVKVSYSWPGVFTSFSANAYATGTHADVAITLAANASVPNILRKIFYSYSGGTPAGSIQVEDGSGTVVFSQDIVAAGPGVVEFDPPLAGTVNRQLVVTLKDGGSAVVGKLNVQAWTEA